MVESKSFSEPPNESITKAALKQIDAQRLQVLENFVWDVQILSPKLEVCYPDKVADAYNLDKELVEKDFEPLRKLIEKLIQSVTIQWPFNKYVLKQTPCIEDQLTNLIAAIDSTSQHTTASSTLNKVESGLTEKLQSSSMPIEEDFVSDDDADLNMSMADINLSSASLDITRTEICVADEEQDGSVSNKVNTNTLELNLHQVEEDDNEVRDSTSSSTSQKSNLTKSEDKDEDRVQSDKPNNTSAEQVSQQDNSNSEVDVQSDSENSIKSSVEFCKDNQNFVPTDRHLALAINNKHKSNLSYDSLSSISMSESQKQLVVHGSNLNTVNKQIAHSSGFISKPTNKMVLNSKDNISNYINKTIITRNLSKEMKLNKWQGITASKVYSGTSKHAQARIGRDLQSNVTNAIAMFKVDEAVRQKRLHEAECRSNLSISSEEFHPGSRRSSDSCNHNSVVESSSNDEKSSSKQEVIEESKEEVHVVDQQMMLTTKNNISSNSNNAILNPEEQQVEEVKDSIAISKSDGSSSYMSLKNRTTKDELFKALMQEQHSFPNYEDLSESSDSETSSISSSASSDSDDESENGQQLSCQDAE